ncbi:AI-2E family transporter [Methylosinus sp. Sm6]|uniref:AI-2E family transporter n=1 Tax=Methylosinus sp. Sm6 TaxID=2866948 RepID=UPI001C9A11C8|nr:AI-2E family transporter [Methylosinus sp. Sm6]MBY6242100.1 AI-2E family transporter [Methylosinus sp. Sm6]
MQNRQIFALLLLGVVVALGVFVVSPFLAPLAWAAILAYATYPVYRRILRLCGDRPSFAATLATLLLVFVLVAPAAFLLIRLQAELAEAYRELSTRFSDEPFVVPDAIARLPLIGPALDETLTTVLNDPEQRREQVKEWLEPWMSGLARTLGKIGRSLAQIALTAVALFFFYRDGDLVVDELRRGLRKVVGPAADDYVRAVGDTTQAVVSGLIISALVQGLIAGIGYAAVGVGVPILLGALTAVTALVPFVGTVAIWAPVGVYLLLSGQIGAGVGLLAWGALVVSWVDNILKPLLISSAADIPLIIVLFGVLGGLLAFGFVGLFLGPLILAVLFSIWREWLAGDGAGNRVED